MQLAFSGEIVARNVTLEEFMAGFGEGRHEYIEGVVIRMSPVVVSHISIETYINNLLNSYFEYMPIGIAYKNGLMLKLAHYPNRRREPDVTVILNASSTELHGATVEGPPDVAIEVVSKESQTRDYEEKFIEYQTAGIPEYWIIDPLRDKATFYRLTDGVYVAHFDKGEGYTTSVLPRFVFDTSVLWQDKLPGMIALGHIVKAMFDDGADALPPEG
jgi:Uma2 family endonuclease